MQLIHLDLIIIAFQIIEIRKRSNGLPYPAALFFTPGRPGNWQDLVHSELHDQAELHMAQTAIIVAEVIRVFVDLAPPVQVPVNT